MYKKIYLEITNNCNLNCDFCIKNKRTKKFMTINEFNIILNKLNGFTKHLYFHILGEPLLHPKINELIDLAAKEYKINITTNGYLVDRIRINKNIRQLNISIHSFDPKYNISLENYMKNIFNTIDVLKKYTYISFRFWIRNKYTKDIIKIINEYYNKNIDITDIKGNITLENNVFISISKEFVWPDLNNDYYNEKGTCYGLIDHMGILVDGTVVPCCLDSKVIINLGNIFNENLNDILNKERCKIIIDGFKNNYKCENLCKKCKFL